MKKVSLYLDEELWIKFKEAVLKRHGTLRKLSDDVEDMIRGVMVDEEVEKAFKEMGLNVKTVVSPEEIKRDRPKLRGPPSEAIIRKMRSRRIEALPRQ